MAPVAAIPAPASRDRVYCAIAVLLLGALYLALHVGRWVPGTDMQYYLDIARSIAKGRGYAFNGSPAGLAPPAWPFVLAGLMKISPAYWFLTLFPTLLVLISVATWYYIIRRWCNPARSLVVMLLCGTFWWWYSSAVLLTSEGLFMAVFSLGLLLSLQIAEGRGRSWRIAALLVLCAAMVCVRFTGLISFAVIAGALCGGIGCPPGGPRWKFGRFSIPRPHITEPAQKKQLKITAAAFAVTVGVFCFNHFVLLKQILPKTVVDPAKITIAERKLAGSGDDAPGVLPGGGPMDLLWRGLSMGRWYAGLFWMPAEVGVSSGAIAMVVNIFGWALIAFFAVTMIKGIQSRDWVWLGAFTLCAALAIRWKSPNSRYIMPIAPLLLAGVWQGMDRTFESLRPGAMRRMVGMFPAAMLISLGLCNLSLWAIDVWVSKRPDYYARYYAGQGKELVSASAWLKKHHLKDNQLAVSALYKNLGRDRQNGLALRGMRALTDRRVRIVPQNVCLVPPDQAPAKQTKDGPINALTAWAQANGVRYYLYRPPTSPWRVWHFRMPWLQAKLTRQKQADIPENPFFELYELRQHEGWFTAAKWVRIKLPDEAPTPDRVAGL